MSEAAIEVGGPRESYGPREAVKGIDLSVARGEELVLQECEMEPVFTVRETVRLGRELLTACWSAA